MPGEELLWVCFHLVLHPLHRVEILTRWPKCYHYCMAERDGRKLSPELQQHNRQVAIKLFQKGVKRKVIAESLEVSYIAVCQWIRLWKKEGIDSTYSCQKKFLRKDYNSKESPFFSSLLQIQIGCSKEHKMSSKISSI